MMTAATVRLLMSMVAFGVGAAAVVIATLLLRSAIG